MSKYLLPCSQCGEQLRIDVGQAGQMVKCECGAETEVPTMRGIRQLPRVEDARDLKDEQSTWSHQQGMLFATGLPVTIVALGICGYLLWQRSHLDTARPVDVARKAEEAKIDELTPEQLWDEWQKIKNYELTRPETPEFELNRIRAQQMLIMAIVSAVVAAVGLGLMGAAFVLKPGSPPRSKRSAAKLKTS